MVDALKLLALFLALVHLPSSDAFRYRKFRSPYNPKLRNALPSEFSYKTMYMTQNVDHFGFDNTQTYQQRYLVSNQFWNDDGGPIFFYTGNEGDIAWFCNNTGFMWDTAPEFKALLVFAEHRYYGESLPYGKDSYANNTMLNYLTAEQAMADFAELIKFIKQTVPGAAKSQVITMGGSYGGMLSAWMRLKYPNLVLGSFAASAPIWQFEGLAPCGSFYEVVQRTFQTGSQQCVDNIAYSWGAMTSLWPGGMDFISKAFSLCDPINNKYGLLDLMDWVHNIYVNLAIVNYPYPASFLEPLPAWPVKPIESKDDLSNLLDWLAGVYGNMAMVDYPYPASFLEPLPAWPVKVGNPASAPTFFSQLQNTFSIGPTTCVRVKVDAVFAAGDLQFLGEAFKLCKPIEDKYALSDLLDWLVEVLGNIAMVDYPYPASFLEPLPAWPAKEFCKHLSEPLKDKALIAAVAEGVKMYFNYTGQASCINMSQEATGNLGDQGWGYQACTEMVMPMCSNNTNMFYNIDWDFSSYAATCKYEHGVMPRENWISLNYWGKDIKAASNIIFSNGLLDPWSGGGVLESLSPSLVAIQIPSGAHHLDLRGKNPGDPADVIAARQQEKNIMKNWLYGPGR